MHIKFFKIFKLFKYQVSFFMILAFLINNSCSNQSEEISNQVPISSFSFENINFYVGDEILFTDFSSDIDGEIISWFWDFGDGNTSHETNPTHIFNSEGEYTITLTVKDDDGGTNKLSKVIQVLAKQNTGVIRIKFMTFNIHAGVSNDGVFDLDAIASVINAHNPDYVALQEVDFNTVRNGKVDLAKVLGQKTNMNYSFGRAIDYQGGQYGNAFLSKRAIESDKNITLPSNNEARAALRISSKVDDSQLVNLVSTHLDYGTDAASKTARIDSAELINNEFANDFNVPTIVAGDFNAIPSAESIEILKEKWTFSDVTNSPTFPSSGPTKKIDYIAFFPENRWNLFKVETINTMVSDHYPLMATLDLILE